MSSSTAKTKLATAVRIVSVAPLAALVALTAMYFCADDIVVAPWQFAVVAACLTLLPVLAYPVHYALPKLRAKGRDGQRTLAIVLSCVGYVVLTIVALTTGFSPKLLIFALTYLLSGVTLLVCRLFKLRPSGHCCGFVGPVAYLVAFVSPYFAFAALLVVAVVWACVALGRHTVAQCIVGSLVPVVAMLISSAIVLFV